MVSFSPLPPSGFLNFAHLFLITLGKGKLFCIWLVCFGIFVWSAHVLMISFYFSPFLLFPSSSLPLISRVLRCCLCTSFSISLLTVAALAFSLAATAQAAPRIITGPAPVLPPAALRTPTPAGPTIMPLIRQIQTAVMPNGTPHPTAAIVPPGPEAGLIYTPYEYPYTLAPATSILEYPIEPSGVLGKLFSLYG